MSIFSLVEAVRSLEGLSGRSRFGAPLDGWSLGARDPAVLRQLMPLMDWLYRYYYRVSTDGWAHVPTDENVMLVGSHNGGVPCPDMHMMLYDWCRQCGVEKPLYGLMHPSVWKASPVAARIAAQMGAVKAHPKMGIAALNENANIAVYPGGAQDIFRPFAMRHQIYFHGRKGFIKLALKKGVPIVPMISVGAHSTLMVLGDVYPQVRQLHKMGMPWLMGVDPEVFPIYLGLPWGIAAGPIPNIPLPVQIHTRICPPVRFDRTGPDAMRDREYVDACYEKVQREMQRALDALVVETTGVV